jgi:hypothetical protein
MTSVSSLLVVDRLLHARLVAFAYRHAAQRFINAGLMDLTDFEDE